MTRLLVVSDIRALGFLIINNLSRWLLPARGERLLARFLGDAAFAVLGRKRRSVNRHLRTALGADLSAEESRKLTRNVFRNRRFESFSFSQANRTSVRQNVFIEGIEHLDEGRRRGRGVILWESSFGKRLLAKGALAGRGYELRQVHAYDHGGSTSWVGRNLVRKSYRKLESKLFSEVIEVQDNSLAYLRIVVDRLRNNGVVCINGTGPMGYKHVSTNFLDGKRKFASGAVSLANMTGASLIPMFCFEDSRGEDRLVIEQPVAPKADQDPEKALSYAIAQYAQLLESYICQYPDQWYLWGVD